MPIAYCAATEQQQSFEFGVAYHKTLSASAAFQSALRRVAGVFFSSALAREIRPSAAPREYLRSDGKISKGGPFRERKILRARAGVVLAGS